MSGQRLQRWLSTQEIAEITGEDPRTINARMRRGELPARRFGRVNKALESDVARWLDSLQPVSERAEPTRVGA